MQKVTDYGTQTTPPTRIPLGKGKVAIVDPELFHDLNCYRWFAKKSGRCWYAVRKVRTKHGEHLIRMHRQITNCPAHQQVHHENHISLDNRLANLLCCTRDAHAIQHHSRSAHPRTTTPRTVGPLRQHLPRP